MGSKITIYYFFHPHFQKNLEVLNTPRDKNGVFTVKSPDGKSLKVPVWMTLERSSCYQISPVAYVTVDALLSLYALIQPHCGDCPR